MTYSGARCNSRNNLQLDAGAFFKNFDMETDLAAFGPEADADAWGSLVKTKGLGATQGGGNFTAAPATRQIPIDGSDPITVYDSWTVTMTANLIEASTGSFEIALGTGVTEDVNGAGATRYKAVRARRQVSSDDYIDNITWIGNIMGYADPVIIQIYNAISTSGININVADKANALIPVTFTSSTDTCSHPELADYAPFTIYYPSTQTDEETPSDEGVVEP